MYEYYNIIKISFFYYECLKYLGVYICCVLMYNLFFFFIVNIKKIIFNKYMYIYIII